MCEGGVSRDDEFGNRVHGISGNALDEDLGLELIESS